jgi:hypothetical protein
MIKLIHLPSFIISLAIGIFLAYTTLDKKQIIYIYPNQDNYKTLQYKDKNGSCLNVTSTKVKCNNNIKSHPIYI